LAAVGGRYEYLDGGVVDLAELLDGARAPRDVMAGTPETLASLRAGRIYASHGAGGSLGPRAWRGETRRPRHRARARVARHERRRPLQHVRGRGGAGRARAAG